MVNAAGNPVALVIDDEDGVRSLLRGILESMGFDVVEAADGMRWWEGCGDREPELAIVDLFMPGQDGTETIGQMRGRWPSLPIVAMSGSLPNAAKSALETAAFLGADRTLMKPFDREVIATLVTDLGLSLS